MFSNYRADIIESRLKKEGMTMAYPNGKLSEEKVFKDPVHRYVHVRDKLIWDLIGTREFQRAPDQTARYDVFDVSRRGTQPF